VQVLLLLAVRLKGNARIDLVVVACHNPSPPLKGAAKKSQKLGPATPPAVPYCGGVSTIFDMWDGKY
jgi:hypothetical protein